MARPPNLIRPSRLSTCLPSDLRYQLDKHLKKQDGGVIKAGSYQKFIATLMRAYFQNTEKRSHGRNEGNSPETADRKPDTAL